MFKKCFLSEIRFFLMKNKPTTSQGPRKKSKNMNNRKNNTDNKVMTAIAPKKIPQSALDTAVFRLSKPSNVQSSSQPGNRSIEPYAVRYFRQNPHEEDDIRTADEKLIDVEVLLNKFPEGEELFEALVKQKILRQIEFGENSPEVVKSHVALADYYISLDQPDSALRHYAKAKQIEKCNPVDNELSVQVAVGQAETFYYHKFMKKKSSYINSAEKAVQPVYGLEIIDPELHLRRDIIRARIARAKNYKNAYELYQIAEGIMNDYKLFSTDENTADFYLEMAELAKEKKDSTNQYRCAEKARDIYGALSLTNKYKITEELLYRPLVREEDVQERSNNVDSNIDIQLEDDRFRELEAKDGNVKDDNSECCERDFEDNKNSSFTHDSFVSQEDSPLQAPPDDSDEKKVTLSILEITDDALGE